MRNLSTHIDADLPVGTGALSAPITSRGSSASESCFPVVQSNVKTEVKSVYSQKTRLSVMSSHTKEAMSFIDRQHRVIKDLIKQMQIFVGYREQVAVHAENNLNSDAWSVYLMHVQSLHDGMNQSFKGKKLFGDGAQPPIRMHLSIGGNVEPFELPDPCLCSLISIRSFLSGVVHHALPSVELSNACIAELLNALVEVQNGRSSLSKISKRLEQKESVRPLSFQRSYYLDGTKPIETNWFTRALSVLGATPSLFRGVPFFARS
jgi:hypothetical protein